MIATFLGGLESVFSWLLAASWQASVLAVLVLVLQAALRGRLNPRWHHALWLLVVARLLLPALPESALSLFQFAPEPPAAMTQSITEPIFAALPPTNVATVTDPAPSASYPYSAFTVLALLWLVGALLLLFVTWQVNHRFARHVTAAPAVNDPRLLDLAATARRELGIHRSLRIIESARVQSPAVMGLFRPTLILPSGVRTHFTDEELRFIFLHEFAHLKRGDLVLQWLVAVLQSLHWFNPVLWYAFRRLRADREPATDALVLSRTGEAQKESYGQVLVKLLEHYHTRHSLPTLVGILEDKNQFKRRFTLIARFSRGAYGWSLLGAILVALLSVLCLTKSEATKRPDAVQPPDQQAKADNETAFHRALENDRLYVADSTVKTSTLEADARMLIAIQKGDVPALKEVLEHAVEPNTFDPDRFGSNPVYWAVYFDRPEILKILLEHFAEGHSRDATETPLQLARRKHPDLVHILVEGIKRNRVFLTTRFKAQLHSTYIRLPAFSGAPLSQVTAFLLEATSKTGYLERGVNIDSMDLPPSTTLSSPAKANVSIWNALQTIADSNNLRFDADGADSGIITLYPPRDDIIVHPKAEQVDEALHTQLGAADLLTIRTFLIPVGFLKAPLVDNADVKPELIARGIAFPAGATAVSLASGKIVVRDTADQLDKLADLIEKAAGAAGNKIEIGLKAIEVSNDIYLANKAKFDAAVENADIGFFVRMKGADFVSTPTVTTLPGQKATIEITREFPYPATFEPAKLVMIPGGVRRVPPTPDKFVTKDIGLSAEFTPTINAADSPEPGKIMLTGKFTVTDFEGFTASNLNVKMPAFDTRESFFIEALNDREMKGIWIPGLRGDEQTITDTDQAGKIISTKTKAANKRLLLFVSARRIP